VERHPQPMPYGRQRELFSKLAAATLKTYQGFIKKPFSLGSTVI
jgi:hypothetical protein